MEAAPNTAVRFRLANYNYLTPVRIHLETWDGNDHLALKIAKTVGTFFASPFMLAGDLTLHCITVLIQTSVGAFFDRVEARAPALIATSGLAAQAQIDAAFHRVDTTVETVATRLDATVDTAATRLDAAVAGTLGGTVQEVLTNVGTTATAVLTRVDTSVNAAATRVLGGTVENLITHAGKTGQDLADRTVSNGRNAALVSGGGYAALSTATVLAQYFLR